METAAQILSGGGRGERNTILSPKLMKRSLHPTDKFRPQSILGNENSAAEIIKHIQMLFDVL